MAVNSGTYGGGLAGPSIRGDREGSSLADRVKRLADLRAGRAPTIVTPAKPTGGKENPIPTPKPKPKPKAKKNPFDTFENALKTPTLTVPTLAQPDLLPIPELQTATLEDYNVTPITIGALPTLEDIPDQQPVVEIDDRQSARMRRAKLAEIANIKSRRGVGATLLSGAPTPARPNGMPANQMARAQLGDNRTVMTRKGG